MTSNLKPLKDTSRKEDFDWWKKQILAKVQSTPNGRKYISGKLDSELKIKKATLAQCKAEIGKASKTTKNAAVTAEKKSETENQYSKLFSQDFP